MIGAEATGVDERMSQRREPQTAEVQTTLLSVAIKGRRKVSLGNGHGAKREIFCFGSVLWFVFQLAASCSSIPISSDRKQLWVS